MSEHHFSNQLAGETSPYLLQHAGNPVQWYSWKEEALDKARQEDKPILVSIGYAACHWCHVMAHESFEDEAIAQFMNENFVNIKIDREERPDIDHIYMNAVQAMTGSGGWPLNVFLTPDLKPFYGGTYFPPRQAFNRPSWKEILESVLEAFRERREKVNEQSDRLVQYLQNSSAVFLNAEIEPATSEDEELIHEAFRNLSEHFDPVYGGFGGAPKFPSTFCIRFLFGYHYYYHSQPALDQALLSLDKMIEGGIYDQLGGGFARYSTDAQWLVPHFEKMLYDNALLLEVLAEAFQITGNKKYETVIRQTIDFVFRELSDSGNDFYASLDADSEGEEGKFYVWTKEEIEKIPGIDADLFCSRYDVGESGNWEGENILHEAISLQDLAKQFRMDEATLERKLDGAKRKLFEMRDRRVHPSLDDKKILSWNALMVSALAKCAQALESEEISNRAILVLTNLFSFFRIKENSQEMFHHITKGKPSGHALLEDYAYLIRACLLVYEISFDTKWILQAKELADFVISGFYDEENQFFFMTPLNEPDIVVRSKEFYDGAIPSGNSVMNENLLRLAILLDEKDFATKNEEMLRSIASSMVRFPTSFAGWLINFSWKMKGSEELVVLGEGFKQPAGKINRHYLPNKIIMASQNPAGDFPLLKEKEILNKQITFFHCKNYACQLPVNNLTEFLKPL